LSNLKELAKELALNMKRASVDLEAAPWQTRSSLTNMKREAEEKVERLKTEYYRRVRSNTFGIFLFGDADRIATFVKIAGEEAGVLEVNGGEIYQKLGDSIEPSLGASREFGPSQLQRLIGGLQGVRQDLDIRSMAMPDIEAVTAVADKQELISYVRKLVQKVVGDDLVRVFVDKRINDLAIQTEFSANVLPLAVTGLDREEISALVPLFTNSVSVEVGTSEDGEVNKEYVLNQLESLKKKLKGSSKTKP
jgi:hypothetical protein